MTYNPLNFPAFTIVAQTVPKNAFYKRAMGTSYDQRLLSEIECEALQKEKKQERQYNLRLEIGRELKQRQAELAKLEEEIETIKNKIR